MGDATAKFVCGVGRYVWGAWPSLERVGRWSGFGPGGVAVGSVVPLCGSLFVWLL